MENNRENTFNLKRYQSRFVLQKRFRKSGNTEGNNQFFTLTFHLTPSTLHSFLAHFFSTNGGGGSVNLNWNPFFHSFPTAANVESAGNDGVHRAGKKKKCFLIQMADTSFHTRYSDEYASRRCIFNAHIQSVYISVASSLYTPFNPRYEIFFEKRDEFFQLCFFFPPHPDPFTQLSLIFVSSLLANYFSKRQRTNKYFVRRRRRD